MQCYHGTRDGLPLRSHGPCAISHIDDPRHIYCVYQNGADILMINLSGRRSMRIHHSTSRKVWVWGRDFYTVSMRTVSMAECYSCFPNRTYVPNNSTRSLTAMTPMSWTTFLIVLWFRNRKYMITTSAFYCVSPKDNIIAVDFDLVMWASTQNTPSLPNSV